MAKPSQEDSDQNKPSAAGRESQFGVREGQFGRESQAAARDMQSAARRAQQAVVELTASAMLQPYAEMMQEIDSFNRDWAERTRSSVERTFDLALKLNETLVSQAKRASDLCLRVYETDVSARTAITRDLQDRASSAAKRFGSQAAAE